MATRPRLATLAILCLTVAAGVAAAVYWRDRSAHGEVNLASGTYLVPARTLAPFKLLDQRGREFTNRNLQAHWSILYFGFTNCPDLCPTTLATLAKVVNNLRAAHPPMVPNVVFVSVDPGRDTPEALARYVSAFDAEFLGVTGDSAAAIEKFTKEMGVAAAIRAQPDGSYSVDHSGALFIVSPEGALRAVLTGPVTVQLVAADLLRIMATET